MKKTSSTITTAYYVVQIAIIIAFVVFTQIDTVVEIASMAAIMFLLWGGFERYQKNQAMKEVELYKTMNRALSSKLREL